MAAAMAARPPKASATERSVFMVNTGFGFFRGDSRLCGGLHLDISNARRHAEFLPANLCQRRNALADLLMCRTCEAQPQTRAGIGFVGRPFRARVDRDARGERGLIELQGID